MIALRAILDVVVALLLPGWLLLRAAGWPRSQPERLLMAGPASIALIAVLTALLGRFGGHPLHTGGLVAVDAALGAVALVRWWTQRLRPRDEEERLPLRWYAVAALPGLLLAGLAVAAVGGLVYPPSEDSLVHADAVRWFLSGLPAPPYQPDHLAAVATPEVRFGFHAFAAALVRGTGLDAGKAVTAATWPVLLLMPGSLMLLVRRAGAGWGTALLAGVAALGIGIVPFQFLALGNAPLLTGAYVVAPAAAVAWCDVIRVRRPGTALVAAVLAGGLIFVHPSDLPTLALMALVLLPVALRPLVRPTWRQAAWAAAAGLAVLGLLRISTQYAPHALAGPVHGTTVDTAIQSDAFFTPRHLSGFWSAVSGDLISFPHDWILPALAVAGVVLAWRRRETRILLALGILLLVCQADAWGWQVPAPLLARAYPWPSPDRLIGLDWFVIPPLAALAVAELAGRLRARVPEAQRRLPWLLGGAAVLAAALPALTFSPGMLQRAHTAQTAITQADLTAFPQVRQHVPVGSLVLTDGIADGGAWLPILGLRDTLLRKEWNHNSAAAEVSDALRELCAPGEAARLQALGVAWVYLGPDPAASAGLADRSCAATGTSELRPVPLGGATPDGPWLLHVETATASGPSSAG